MIQPTTLAQLLASNPLAETHEAIVETLKALLPGVNVVRHPGKVDIAELVQKTIVNAPGIGVGWSRVRPAMLADGSYSVAVEWTVYIVAEAKPIANRRVEKEAVAMAIGGQMLKILADFRTSTWGRTGVVPITSESPAPELKPLFTVRNESQGTVYYTVSWTQLIVDIGASLFPQPAGSVDLENGAINWPAQQDIADIAPWIPGMEVDDA